MKNKNKVNMKNIWLSNFILNKMNKMVNQKNLTLYNKNYLLIYQKNKQMILRISKILT